MRGLLGAARPSDLQLPALLCSFLLAFAEFVAVLAFAFCVLLLAFGFLLFVVALLLRFFLLLFGFVLARLPLVLFGFAVFLFRLSFASRTLRSRSAFSPGPSSSTQPFAVKRAQNSFQ
jgi:hypothetical protein